MMNRHPVILPTFFNQPHPNWLRPFYLCEAQHQLLWVETHLNAIECHHFGVWKTKWKWLCAHCSYNAFESANERCTIYHQWRRPMFFFFLHVYFCHLQMAWTCFGCTQKQEWLLLLLFLPIGFVYDFECAAKSGSERTTSCAMPWHWMWGALRDDFACRLTFSCILCMCHWRWNLSIFEVIPTRLHLI